jgi:hypothetical protein
MISMRWIFPAVALIFALALLPRGFVAAEFSSPRKTTNEPRTQPKFQDRFVPGAGQPDQLMSLPETARDLTVASGNTQNENDLTGTVEPVAPYPRDNSALSGIELPVATAALGASRQTKSAKREDHRIRAASGGARQPLQTKLAASGRSTHDIDSIAHEQEGQIPAPNFTFSAY